MDMIVTTLAILDALLFVCIISVLYRRNAIYTFTQNLITGVGVGVTFVININTLYSNGLQQLLAGDFFYIIPMLWGITYLFVLIRSLRSLYRTTTMLALAATLGTGFSVYMLSVYTILSTFGKPTNIEGAVTLVSLIIIFLYFIYSKKLARYSAPLRTLGLYGLYTFFGLAIGPMFFRYLTSLIGISFDIMAGPGMYIIVLAAVVLIIHAAYRSQKS